MALIFATHADSVTYRDLPPDLVASQIKGNDVAFINRVDMWTECGLWLIDCARPGAQKFLETVRRIYLTDAWKPLPYWFDCMIVDMTLRALEHELRVANLSGAHKRHHHPQAFSELGKYIDHPKGDRKLKGRSSDNEHRLAWEKVA